MNRKTKGLAWLLLAVVALVSCGKKVPNEAKYIPKDASTVIVVDIKSMGDKLKDGKVDFQSAFKEILGNDTADLNKSMKEIEGLKEAIDLEAQQFFFMTNRLSANGKVEGTSFNLIGKLKDAAKLEAFLKTSSAFKNEVITKEKEYSYLIEGNNMAISWNTENVILTGYEKDFRIEYDTSGNPIFPDRSKAVEDVKAEIKKYYTLKKEESIASVDVFKNLFSKKADGYLFSSTNSAGALLDKATINLPKLKELAQNNYSCGTFNFENGKVVFSSDFYPNAQVANILKTYKSGDVKTELLEHYPSQNINGFMLFNVDPQLFSALLKEVDLKGLADLSLGSAGLTSDDVIKSIKGDIALAVSDFTMTIPTPPAAGSGEEEYYMYRGPQPSLKMVLNIPVGDVAAYRKIMEQAVQRNLVIKQGAVYKLNPALPNAKEIYLQADDKNLILSSDSATYAAYVAGTAKANISSEIMSKVKGKSGAMYVNIQSVLTGFSSMVSSPQQKNMYDIVNNTFKDAYLTSDKFDGKVWHSDAIVNMKDDKQNSLVSISKMTIELAKAFKAMYSGSRTTYDDMPPPPPPIVDTTRPVK